MKHQKHVFARAAPPNGGRAAVMVASQRRLEDLGVTLRLVGDGDWKIYSHSGRYVSTQIDYPRVHGTERCVVAGIEQVRAQSVGL